MGFINVKKKEVQIKIVYYGPGRGGKTTNLDYINKKYKQRIKTEMVSIKTHGDRTLFFDFLPVDIGKIHGFDIKIQLYTVPGQVKYGSTRKLVLKGADGLVFVADSMIVRREKNMISLKDLAENLKEYGLSIFKVPLVIQYNKRDLEAEGIPLMPIDQMEKELNRQLRAPSFPASAFKGDGVSATLKEALKLTLKHLQKEMRWAE